MAYPIILIGGFFVFKKDHVPTKFTVDKYYSSKMTYLSSNDPIFYGPFLEDLENPKFVKDLRHFSLATGKPKSFVAFKEALGFKESQGRYSTINSLGYLGKYQFGMTTLQQFGVRDSLSFLRSPRLQERIFVKNLQYNHRQLNKYIEKYNGKNIGGVIVTESGILAAAHLSGAGGVRKYLRSNGRGRSRDAYGSSVRGYMKKFGGYDISTVVR
jgi:hypothetical protein